jgi:hypothetical protein
MPSLLRWSPSTKDKIGATKHKKIPGVFARDFFIGWPTQGTAANKALFSWADILSKMPATHYLSIISLIRMIPATVPSATSLRRAPTVLLGSQSVHP